MRYLGLDLGTKTLGVSVSDKLGLIASTLKTIHFYDNNYEDAFIKLDEIIKDKNINIIVLGLPKNMDNSLGESAKRSLNFKILLEKRYNLQVILQDERMSSVEANNIMIEGDLSRKKRKNMLIQ